MFSRARKFANLESLETRQFLSVSPISASAEAAPGIQQLVLVNADNGALIGPFENNTTVNYAALPTNLSVRAYPAGPAGSVRFAVDGNPNVQTENFEPFYLLGDTSAGMPNVWRPNNGTHSMKVTAFGGANAAGAVGAAMNLTFHVGNAPNTAPTVVNGPTVTFTDNAADAKEAGLDKGTFVVSRTGSTSSSLTVAYNVAGSATNGSDYNTLSGQITIPAGKSSVELVITPKDDSAVEGTENVVLSLIGGANYNVGSANAATCPILDNDSGTSSNAVVTFSDSSADAKEAGLDGGTLVVSRTGSTASALSVAYNVGGSASNGADYDMLSGMITIPAGKSSANLFLIPKDDSLVEGTENIVITVIAGNGYSLGSALNATVPILDNDSTGSTPGTGQNISDITWTSSNVKRSPIPRTEAGSIQIGSKVYAIGGFTAEGGTGSFFPLTRRVDVYDMATKTWKQLASIPSSAAGNHFGVATDGSNIYTVAGQTGHTYGAGTNTVYKYNIASNSWSQFVSLPEVRFGGAAFVEDGWLHYVGGDKADRETPSTDHWAINLSNTGAGWIRKASMPLSGDHMSHTSINGKVYIFGGEHGHHGLTAGDENGYIQHKYTFEYNPDNDTWTRKADMPLALSHIEGSTLAINGKAVLIGGLLTGGGSNTTNRVHVYDPANNTWKTLSTRYPKRIIGSESGYWNGKIYMTDGYSPDSDDRQKGFEGTVKFV